MKQYPPNGYVTQWIVSQFPEGYQGHCIDVGASDGYSVNSTYLLEAQYHWTVVSVEPQPCYHAALAHHRAWVEKSALASLPMDEAPFFVNLDNPEAYSGLRKPIHPRAIDKMGSDWTRIKVPVRTLDQVLTRWEFPKLDALCVDTEGSEMDVLEGLDWSRWSPKVLVVESWDEVGPVDAYLDSKGYDKTKTRLYDNYLYLRRDV